MEEPSRQLRSGDAEAIILVKAAPQVGSQHGETVCCAGLDVEGNWLRLYPVSFRHLADGQRFKRWDRIKFRWRLPNDDRRSESRRVDQDSIEIVGSLPKQERGRLLRRKIVSGLEQERAAGRSFALLQPKIREFLIERKSESDFLAEARRFAALRNQLDLFNSKPVIPYRPSPYAFKYRYSTADGEREGTCQDWEIEATFFNWSNRYGEAEALAKMQNVFGSELPAKGILFAMGTHSLYPDRWLINGVIQYNEPSQETLL